MRALSPAQKKLIKGLQEGRPIYELFMHLKTVHRCIKLGLLERQKDGKVILTDEGLDLKIN